MKKTTILLFAAVLCLMTQIAQAVLIFDFSFDNTTGNTAGPITGEIHFNEVTDFTSAAAAKVIITGVGDHTNTTFMTPFDVITGGWNLQTNSFTVSLGVITDWDFYAVDGSSDVGHDFNDLLDLGSKGTYNPEFWSENKAIVKQTIAVLDDINFTPHQVPEPSTVPLMVIGLAVLGFTRRKVKT